MLRQSTESPYKLYELYLSEIGREHLRPGDLTRAGILAPYFKQLRSGDVVRVHGTDYVAEMQVGFEVPGASRHYIQPLTPRDFPADDFTPIEEHEDFERFVKAGAAE